MSSFPNSPKLIKGGLVLVDADTARVLSVISLQYNSDSLTRTLQVQTTGGQAADRVEPVRFKGPAVETFKLDLNLSPSGANGTGPLYIRRQSFRGSST